MNTVPLSTPDDVSALQRYCRDNFLLLMTAASMLWCCFVAGTTLGTKFPTPDNHMIARGGMCGWLASMVIVPMMLANGSRQRFNRATAATALVGTVAIILIILRWGV